MSMRYPPVGTRCAPSIVYGADRMEALRANIDLNRSLEGVGQFRPITW